MTAPATFDPGKKPDLKFLPVARLRVDPTYQRSLESANSQALVRRIGANFQWVAFGAVLVVVDGKKGWLILDGQHRVAGAKLAGIDEVPSIIVEAASVAEQAAAFVRANRDRVQLNVYALFHARLAAGEVEAAELARQLKKAGIVVPRYQPPADRIEPGVTIALGTLQRIARKYPPAVCSLIFGCIANAYCHIPGGLRASYFAAAERVIGEVDPIGRQRAAEKITAFLATKSLPALGALIARQAELHGFKETDALTKLFRSALTSPVLASPGDRARMMAGR
jgi:hypothetical protein